MSYRVSIPSYSGPFDLLLQLVSRQKVDIGAVSISEITDQYLAETEQLQDMDLDVASDFLLVAATLLDIKAASLLPEDEPSRTTRTDDLSDEYDGLDADSMREVLIQRLIAYKQIRNAAAALGARMEAESRMHPRTAGPDPEFLGLMPDYLKGVTLRGLAVICADLDSRREEFLLEAEHVAPHRAPIELTIAAVDRATMARPHMEFTDLIDEDTPTDQVVASFLAVLELSKCGSIELAQEEAFGPIAIDRVEGAPAWQPDGDVETYDALAAEDGTVAGDAAASEATAAEGDAAADGLDNGEGGAQQADAPATDGSGAAADDAPDEGEAPQAPQDGDGPAPVGTMSADGADGRDTAREQGEMA